MTVLRLALAVVLLMSAAACDDDPPTDPTPIGPTSVTDIYSATLAPGGSLFYSFPVFEDGAIRLTLASVTDGVNGPALSPTLRLGLGIPSGTDCATFTELHVQPSLVPQVDGFGINAGTYCARVADAGSLTSQVVFALRMVYPNPPNISVTTPKAETFASTLAVNGASSRTLLASQAGTVTVSLDSLGGTASRVGIGFGVISRVDQTCRYARSIETGPGGGPHISLPVSAGEYCLRVFDVGALTAPTAFSVSVNYP